MMDTRTLKVGQKVVVYGCGFWDATVVRLVAAGVEVKSFGILAQFDKEGKETEDSRFRRLGVLQGPGPEWVPWELAD